MKEIPNAETYLNDKSSEIPSKYKDLNAFLHDSQIAEIMIEFAKLHVTQALIEAVKEAPLHCKEGILNCYSLDNIK